MRSRRRAVASLALAGVVTSAVGIGTVANFADTESTPGNRFTAGTLDLTAGPQSQAWTVDNMAPGDTEYRTISVGSAGTLPLEYTASATLVQQADAGVPTHPGSAANGGLGEALKLQYRGAVSGNAACNASAAAISTTDAFGVGAAKDIDLNAPSRVLAAGASELLCFSFELPLASDNRYQGDSANFTLGFSSKQADRGSASATDDVAATTSFAVRSTPSDSAAAVSWDATPGAASYSVTLSPASAVTGSATRTTKTTKLDFTGLKNGQAYVARVVAMDAAGKQISSATSKAFVPFSAGVAPSAVQNLAAVAGDGSLKVSWTAPTSGAAVTGYTVSLSPSDGKVDRVLSASTTSVDLSGLDPATAYTVTVTPTSAAGAGAPSATAATYPAVAPTAPNDVTVAESLNGGLRLNWTAPTGGSPVTTYRVEATPEAAPTTVTTLGGSAVRLGAGASANGVVTADVSGTTTDLLGLDPTLRYTVKVIASNRGGVSPASAATAPAVPATKPAAPAVSGVVANGGVDFSWTPGVDAAASPATGYVLVVKNAAGDVVRTQEVTGTTFRLEGVPATVAYTLSVTPKNLAGAGKPTTSQALTPVTDPGAVQNLTATTTLGKVAIAWTAPPAGGAPVKDYVITGSPAEGDLNSPVVLPPTATSYSAQLTSGQRYNLTVTARSVVQEGAPSSVAILNLNKPEVAGTVYTAAANGAVTATWSSGPLGSTYDAPSEYIVELKAADGTVVKTTKVAATVTTMTYDSIPSGTYTFAITAQNGAGSASAPRTATVIGGGYAPGAVTAVIGTNTVNGTTDAGVTATWGAPTADAGHDAATAYDVRLLSGTTEVAKSTVTGTSVRYPVSAPGAYTVEVKAKNAAGTAAAGTGTAAVKRYTATAVQYVSGYGCGSGDSLSGSTCSHSVNSGNAQVAQPGTTYTCNPGNSFRIYPGSCYESDNFHWYSSTATTTYPASATYATRQDCLVGDAVSGSVCARILAPNSISNLTATQSGGTVALSWSAGAVDDSHDAATSYRVRLLSGATEVKSTTVTSASAVLSDFARGDYTVEVTAINNAGSAVAATSAPITAGGYAPTAVTNLTATSAVDTKLVTASWSAAASGSLDGAVSYEVSLLQGGAAVTSATTSSTSASFSAVSFGSYTLQVVARNAVGSSTASTTVNVTTAPPATPTGVTVTRNSATAATVSWTPGTGSSTAAAGFDVSSSGSSNGPWTKVTTAAAGSTSAAVTTTAGATYYRVVATNTYGDPSAASAAVLLPAALVAPQGFYAEYNTDSGNAVTLRWNAPDAAVGVTSHKLYASNSGSGPWTLVATVGGTATSASVTGNPAAWNYYQAYALTDTATSPVASTVLPARPPAITGMTITPTSAGRVIVSWNAPTPSLVAGMVLYTAKDASGTGQLYLAAPTNDTTSVIAYLQYPAGSNYYKLVSNGYAGTSNSTGWIKGP